MENVNYTSVSILLPEMEATIAERKRIEKWRGILDPKTNMREKNCSGGNERSGENWRRGSCRGPRGGRGKMPRQEMWSGNRRMRLSDCGWRTNCCGIFCSRLEGGEASGKIPHHISPPGRVSSVRLVPVFRSIQERILCFCPSSWQT